MTKPDVSHSHLEEALPGFCEARLLIKATNDSLRPLGLTGDKFEFYRFVNRYRMAVRFAGVKLEGFEQDTVDGYSALTRAFLTWSVFERYAELADLTPPFRGFLSHVPKIEFSKLAQIIESHDPAWKLFDFLRAQATPANRASLDNFRKGERREVIFYASAIRHIYVHGHLTAHPNGCKSPEVAVIADALSQYLLDWIGADFRRRLAIGRAMAKPTP